MKRENLLLAWISFVIVVFYWEEAMAISLYEDLTCLWKAHYNQTVVVPVRFSFQPEELSAGPEPDRFVIAFPGEPLPNRKRFGLKVTLCPTHLLYSAFVYPDLDL